VDATAKVGAAAADVTATTLSRAAVFVGGPNPLALEKQPLVEDSLSQRSHTSERSLLSERTEMRTSSLFEKAFRQNSTMADHLAEFARLDGTVQLDLDLDITLRMQGVENFVSMSGLGKKYAVFNWLSMLLPSIATCRIYSFKFTAPCRIWWHVHSKRIKLAFKDFGNEELKLEELDMSLEWDIDLVTCGLAWPDFLEDKLLAKSLLMMIKNYDESNPLEYSLAEVEQAVEDDKAAVKLQSAARALKIRKLRHQLRASRSKVS